MAAHIGKPLTRFLIALAHSPELLRRYRETPAEVLGEWGLQEFSSILHPDATLRQIQEAISAEHAGEKGDATAMWWILVGSAPAEPNWIQVPSADDSESGGGGGGGAKPTAQ